MKLQNTLFKGKNGIIKTGSFYKTLGSGGSAIVKVYNTFTCKSKFIVKELINLNRTNIFINEFKIGSLLEHENIIKIFDIDVTNRYLLLEYYEGIDLFTYMELNNYSQIPNIEKLKVMLDYYQQLLCGVEYMHVNSIAHMDLKLDNIIINPNDKSLKIIDFGLSKQFQKNKGIPTIRWCGTLDYIPPEIIEYKTQYPNKVDIWYCGIILYNLLYDCMPWNKACYKTDDIYFVNEFNFKRDKLYINTFYFDNFNFTTFQTEQFSKLFKQLFKRNPVIRYNIQELLYDFKDLYYTFC